jgi:hypothetical protein
VFRSKKSGAELDAATYDRLKATLDTHDSEAAKLEAEIELRRQQGSTTSSSASSASGGSSSDSYPGTPT